MRRRDFVAMLGGVATALPLGIQAEEAVKQRRVGILMNRGADATDGKARLRAIDERLKQMGWDDGQSFVLDVRWDAEDPELARKGAAELVAMSPDVVLAGGTIGVLAMIRESKTIPVVFAGVADPVGLGLVASLSRPGGNATGFSSYDYSLSGKLVELLKQAAPGTKRAAVLRDPSAPQGIVSFGVIQGVAASLGIAVHPVNIRNFR